ncbi:MAG: DUF4249 domain-containing protein [Bacteroidia bacterium]|nr:DUF4249 domain-containing protein [Bacteroidia bacterium]
MRNKGLYLVLFSLLSLVFVACEKEIKIDLPASKEELVVEASINQLSINFNYVILSTTLDYFNPSLSLSAVRGAEVYITEGNVVGSDTVFNINDRVQFFDYVDTIFPGIYLSADFRGQEEKPYKLEVFLKDGRTITGTTFIPKAKPIDSLHFWFEPNKVDTNVFFYMHWLDGPEQDNYRLTLRKGYIPILTGWGYGSRFYTFDDSQINNQPRPFLNFSPYKYNDTLHIYLATIGRKEYLFWDSFRGAANNGGPFATPVEVKSNVEGAIGSFTGYGLYQRSVIFRQE